MKFRVLMQPQSKCLFIKGVKFDYLEICNESCYRCDEFALKILVTLIIHTCLSARRGYIVYCLQFLFVLFVRLRSSPARIKLVASNARWFMGDLGRESQILGNFAPPKAQNRTNRTPAVSVADTRHAVPFTAGERAGHALGMCRYTAVPIEFRLIP